MNVPLDRFIYFIKMNLLNRWKNIHVFCFVKLGSEAIPMEYEDYVADEARCLFRVSCGPHKRSTVDCNTVTAETCQDMNNVYIHCADECNNKMLLHLYGKRTISHWKYEHTSRNDTYDPASLTTLLP